MKLNSILSIAAAGLLLASCSGADSTPKTSADESAKADSLIYCFGQLRGSEFLNEAKTDTLLSAKYARQEYLSGVKAGLAAVKAKKEAYNKGLFLGMQMAMNIQGFEDEYGIRLSDKLFLEGLSKTLESDTAMNSSELQAVFYRLMNEMNEQKAQRDKEAAESVLKKEAEAKGLTLVADGVYGKLTVSKGERIKEGDKIDDDIVVTTLDGREIAAPFPKSMIVGQRLQNSPISAVLTSLSSGEKGTFLTTAYHLFGQRASQMGLKSDEILQFTITATVVPSDESAESK